MSSYFALAEFYDALTADVNHREWADYFEAALLREGKDAATVLDLCCGTGALTLELARRGYETIGVDISAEMLAAASEKAATDSVVRPLFINQDICELDLYGTVGAAVCCLDGLNYLTPAELSHAFSRVILFLEPGGLFMFDLNSEAKLKSMDGETYIDETDEVYCIWRAEYEEEEECCFIGMDIFSREGGLWRLDREEHIEYTHSVKAVLWLLREAGFERAQAYGEGFSEPLADTQRIYFTAAKPGKRDTSA